MAKLIEAKSRCMPSFQTPNKTIYYVGLRRLQASAAQLCGQAVKNSRQKLLFKTHITTPAGHAVACVVGTLGDLGDLGVVPVGFLSIQSRFQHDCCVVLLGVDMGANHPAKVLSHGMTGAQF